MVMINFFTSSGVKVALSFKSAPAQNDFVEKEIYQVRQTVIDMQKPLKPQLEYTKNMVYGVAFNPEAKNILVLGLGGGYLPGILYDVSKNASIDSSLFSIGKRLSPATSTGYRSTNAPQAVIGPIEHLRPSYCTNSSP